MKTLSIIFLTLVFVSCQNQQKVDEAKKASIDSMQTEINRQKTIDSMQLEIAKVNEEKERAQNVTVVNQPAATTNTPAKKKGWSSTAKGAVIGAGVGAATGAIVSKKKKGQGAIIGGLVGAGVGAGTGAIIDDSKKKKE
ncbi:MAG: YMGG-like glycine zipper-containing protein [Bacteroidota bacterium]